MARPVILAVDDDANVLSSIERDLRSRYIERHRILRADSGASALDVAKKLYQRNEALALIVMDYRMPHMDGVETISQLMKIYPEAKRVLLTAYADTEAAIRAINDVQLHHYLLKPWDPPEQQLFPVLDDLLDDWNATHRPAEEGLRVLGTRWAPKCYETREFLARNQVPYEWLDVDAADRIPEIKRLVETLESSQPTLPVLLFPDGTQLHQPAPVDIAEKLGLRTRAGLDFYDVAIVGGGPAGLAAAVYGASEGLKTVMVEREAPGGQAGLSSRIENYLGFPSGLSGSDLARRAVAQARRFGVEIVSPALVTGVRVEGPYRYLQLSDNTQLSCHALLLAMGVQWRKLDVPGIERFQGAGVYYGGGSTEALSCENEEVFIVGGANSAGQAAMSFSRFARRVVMLVRGKTLASTMSAYLIDQIAATSNIEVRYESEIVGVDGDDRLRCLTVSRVADGSRYSADAGALFIFIGAEPRTDWLTNVIERDARGFVLTGRDLVRDGKRPKNWALDRDPGLLETNVPGIFAVGDVRHGSIKRVASSVGEGSIAIQFVHQYLSKVETYGQTGTSRRSESASVS